MAGWFVQSLQLYLELTALHAQILHGLGDGGRQLGGGFLACLRAFASLGHESVFRFLFACLQRGQIDSRVQFHKFLLPAVVQRWQFLGRAFVAS